MWLSLLLNPRTLILMALVVTNAFTYFKAHRAGYEEGRADVQAQFNLFKEQAAEQAMAEKFKRDQAEALMKATNQKVTADYESLKKATANAVGALDSDRLRLLKALAAARHSSAPGDPQTGLPVDAPAQDRIVASCTSEYEAVVRDARENADQLKALQDYVSKVIP
jgi:hypothetical protein